MNEITIIIILVHNLIFAVKNEIHSLTKWSKLFQQIIHIEWLLLTIRATILWKNAMIFMTESDNDYG